MPDALAMLLNAADDAALARAVTTAGGTETAMLLLHDAAYQFQAQGAPHAEILAVGAVLERVDALAQRHG